MCSHMEKTLALFDKKKAKSQYLLRSILSNHMSEWYPPPPGQPDLLYANRDQRNVHVWATALNYRQRLCLVAGAPLTQSGDRNSN